MCISVIVIGYVTMGKATHYYLESQEIPMILFSIINLRAAILRQSESRKLREMLSSLT